MLVLISDQWYQFFIINQMRRETALFPKRISICQNCKAKYNLLFVFISLQDEDECSTGSHTCSSDEACVNTEGTYSCDCGPGLKWNSNKMRCRGNSKPRKIIIIILKCKICIKGLSRFGIVEHIHSCK